MIKSIVAAALTAAVITAAPAAASDRAWQVGNDSFHVEATGLDLNTTGGRAAMLGRVERTAQKLCRDRMDRADCTAETIRLVAASRAGAAVQLALAERRGTAMAAR